MNCKEVAVFKFREECIDGAIALNKKLISEMQKESNNTLINFEVLQSLKDPSILTWLIEWTDSMSAKDTTDKWLSFPSNQEFSSSVEQDIFYDFFEKT